MKVSELNGALLAYWIAKVSKLPIADHYLELTALLKNDGTGIYILYTDGTTERWFAPAWNWADGGPIIERDQIFLEPPHDVHRANIRPDGRVSGVWETYESWHATVSARTRTYPNPNFKDPENWPGCVGRGEGHTPLLAAMRAKVASHYGQEVPDIEHSV